jgi:hypothetical protein
MKTFKQGQKWRMRGGIIATIGPRTETGLPTASYINQVLGPRFSVFSVHGRYWFHGQDSPFDLVELVEDAAVVGEGSQVHPSMAMPSAPASHWTPAAVDVMAERRRQVTGEGWTAACDDEHAQGQMALAAACYATGHPAMWPWSAEWWKPSNTRRNLVKAGALILAEIERLDREAAQADTGKTLMGVRIVIDDSLPPGVAEFRSGRRTVRVENIGTPADPVADTMDHAQLQALGNQAAWREQQSHGQDMTKPCAREQFPNEGRGRTCERCAGSPVCTGHAWADPFHADGRK